MTARLEAETGRRSWRNIRRDFTNDEILDLVRQTKELKEYQDTPSTKEELGADPPACRSDMEPGGGEADLF